MKIKICEVIIGVCSVLLCLITIAIPIVGVIISKRWLLLALELIFIPSALEVLCQTFEYIETIERKRRDNNDGE